MITSAIGLVYLGIGVLWFCYVAFRYIANKHRTQEGLMIACVLQWPLTMGAYLRRCVTGKKSKFDVLYFDHKGYEPPPVCHIVTLRFEDEGELARAFMDWFDDERNTVVEVFNEALFAEGSRRVAYHRQGNVITIKRSSE